MEKGNLSISAGGMYQEWNCLMDLVDEDMALFLEKLANANGWCEIPFSKAVEMGFGELAEWSVAKTDTLALIDNIFLVCLHKSNLR